MRIQVPAAANVDVSDRVARILGAVSYTDDKYAKLGCIDSYGRFHLASDAGAHILAGSLAAAGGQSAQINILNPAASGKNLILDYALISSTATTYFRISNFTGALPGTTLTPRTRKIGATPGVATASGYASASDVGTTFGTGTIIVNEEIKLFDRPFFLLTPAQGITFALELGATTFRYNLGWQEEPATSP